MRLRSWTALAMTIGMFGADAARAGDEAGAAAAPVRTVDHVDLARYAGEWHQIALIPNRFQDQCAGGTTATYTRRDDGRINVLNRCRTSDGELDEAEGLAKIENPATNAELKVSFVSFLGWRPFWGDYWVIGLDEHYRWAAVGTPNRKYGWILARTPTLDDATLDRVFTIFEQNGYDRGDFEMSPP